MQSIFGALKEDGHEANHMQSFQRMNDLWMGRLQLPVTAELWERGREVE